MTYEERIVCFLDVLGFSGHIRSTVRSDGSDNESQISLLVNSFELIREILDIENPEARDHKEVTQFSDSIVISFPIDEVSGVVGTLLEVLWIQINLVQRGILCRGAMVRGKLLHTRKVLFGPAMVEAYQLESRVAIYPRVILDESIIDIGAAAHAEQHDGKYERESIMKLLSRDGDGMYYIDYITRAQFELNDPREDYPNYLYLLRKLIADGIKNHDPSVRAKYLWMKEKFSPYLTEVKTWAIKNFDDDDELRQAYELIGDL